MNLKRRDVNIFYLSDLKIPLPTDHRASICLLAADHWTCFAELERIVEALVPRGCRFFMTWGNKADQLHDKLDEILESSYNKYLYVVTTSHLGESISDLVWFFSTLQYWERNV